MTAPLVTIVTAAYKTNADHLREALESAAGQTFEGFELIVSDDSPDDRLGAIVAGVNDPRFRYRHNQPALGVAGNHWACLREASGRYVAILNHDDRLGPTFLERLVAPLESDAGLALSFCDHLVIDGEGRLLADATEANSTKWGRAALRPGVHRPFAALLANQTIPMAMGTVFRRDLLPTTLEENAGPAYDLWVTYWLCRTGLGAYYVADRLSSWRTHPVNLTSQAGVDWAVGGATCWSAIAADPALADIRDAARAQAALFYFECARGAWRRGDQRASARFARRSLRIRPTWRGAAACMLSFLPAPRAAQPV